MTSLFCQLLASLFTLVCLPVSDVLIDRYFSLELYQDYCNSLLTAAVLVYFHLILSVESVAACLVYRAHCSDCSMQVLLASSILFSSLLSCYLVADPSSDLSSSHFHSWSSAIVFHGVCDSLAFCTWTATELNPLWYFYRGCGGVWMSQWT